MHFFFLRADYHDEGDEEEEYESEGEEESGEEQGSHDSEEDDNVTVGLTPQQQELLQIVSCPQLLQNLLGLVRFFFVHESSDTRALSFPPIFRQGIEPLPGTCGRSLNAGSSPRMRRK